MYPHNDLASYLHTNRVYAEKPTLENVDECYKFFVDLCTTIELKSFAQRFHVARLLDEHRVYNSIVSETGASTATISRVNRSLQDGNDGYNIVFTKLKEKGLL